MAQASGSVGGLVASNNRGGNYFRRRAIPVNPRTQLQHDVRQALGTLAQQYSQILTEEQRQAWILYGKNVPLVNAVGDARQQSGIAAFIRSNTPRLQGGIAEVLDAPTNFTLGVTPAFTVGPMGTGATAGLNFIITNLSQYSEGDQFILFMGRPQQPSINYFSGPYRATGNFNGSDGGLFLLWTDLAYVASNGQKLFFRCTASMEDGRYSTAAYQTILATTAPAAAAAAVAAPAATAAAKEKRAVVKKPAPTPEK